MKTACTVLVTLLLMTQLASAAEQLLPDRVADDRAARWPLRRTL